MSCPPVRDLFLAAGLLVTAPGLCLESPDLPSAASMTSAQVVEQMQSRNQSRTDGLKHSTAVRHYQVEYKEYGADLDAKMEVEVTFEAPTAKSFRVVSQPTWPPESPDPASWCGTA